MSVALAVLAALCWGVSDFLGGVVSRRVSVWTVSVLSQLSSLVGMVVVAAVAGVAAGTGDLVWGGVAGLGSGMGTVFLYRGLSSGRMSVVAPLSGVGAALVPVLVGAVAGERPTPLAWAGVAVAFPGIWLVAREPDDVAATELRQSGAVDGVLAGLGFGVMFAALGQVPDGAGLWPLVSTQVLAAVTVVGLALGSRQRWLPHQAGAWWGLAPGVLAAGAAWAFLEASQTGLLAVTGVIASLYPAGTVLLAALVLREHVRGAQALGLALCGLAVGLVALA